MSNKRNEVQDNPVYTWFTVIDDPSGLFNVGATIFPAMQIIGARSRDFPVSDDELPEGIEMLYKRYNEVIYRCKFYNGKLRVVAKQ